MWRKCQNLAPVAFILENINIISVSFGLCLIETDELLKLDREQKTFLWILQPIYK